MNKENGKNVSGKTLKKAKKIARKTKIRDYRFKVRIRSKEEVEKQLKNAKSDEERAEILCDYDNDLQAASGKIDKMSIRKTPKWLHDKYFKIMKRIKKKKTKNK